MTSQVAPCNYDVTTQEGAEYRRNGRDILPIPEDARPTDQAPTEQASRRSTRISQPTEKYASLVTHSNKNVLCSKREV